MAIEVMKDGQFRIVSKKKPHSKPRPEKAYVIEDDGPSRNELQSKVDMLEHLIDQLKEENRDMRKMWHDTERVVKEWKAEAAHWKEKSEEAETGRALLSDKVERRNEDLRKKSREIKELSDDKRDLKKKNDELLSESIKRGDTITQLKDENRRLKAEKTSLQVKEEALQDEVKQLTRVLFDNDRDDRDYIRRRRPVEPERRRPYDTDYWDRVGPLPLRDPLRPRWAARDYDSN